MKVFGLTGGIACGKSTVSRLLQEKNFPVFDADQAARKVVEPGSPAHTEIVALFGDGVVEPDGSLDRKKIGSLVFSDAVLRDQLEGITHPRIRDWIAKQILQASSQGESVAIVDAALMIETNWYKEFAGVIVVWCSKQDQINRLVQRDEGTEEEAKARIDSQMPLDKKRELADFVVDNSGPIQALVQEVDQLAQWLHEQSQ